MVNMFLTSQPVGSLLIKQWTTFKISWTGFQLTFVLSMARPDAVFTKQRTSFSTGSCFYKQTNEQTEATVLTP